MVSRKTSTRSKKNVSALRFPKPKDNTRPKMPPDVRKAVKARQTLSVAQYADINKQLTARSRTADDAAQYGEIIRRMAEKIGITDEVMAIVALRNRRARRLKRALQGSKWTLSD